MLPLRDSNPTQRTAVVTIALIAVNVAVFLTEPLAATQSQQARYFYCHAAIPYEVVHRHALPQLAALGCGGKNVWVSILQSMFLHAGWLHIGGNMLFLWIFGNNVEDRLGRAKYLAFYLLCGLAATAAQTALSPSSTVPLIGASGAIAGVLGAYLVMYPRARVLTFVFFLVIELPAVVVLAGWIVMQVFQGVGSLGRQGDNVAYFAHIGGFLAGIVLLAVLRPSRRPPAFDGSF